MKKILKEKELVNLISENVKKEISNMKICEEIKDSFAMSDEDFKNSFDDDEEAEIYSDLINSFNQLDDAIQNMKFIIEHYDYCIAHKEKYEKYLKKLEDIEKITEGFWY
jgi:hypothetical protein